MRLQRQLHRSCCFASSSKQARCRAHLQYVLADCCNDFDARHALQTLSAALAASLRVLAASHGAATSDVDAAAAFAAADLDDPVAAACGDKGAGGAGAGALLPALVHVCAASPVHISTELIAVTRGVLAPEQTVEAFAWLAVLCMLDRLYAWFLPGDDARGVRETREGIGMGADAPAPTDVDDVRAYFKRVGKDGALRDAYRLPGEVTHGLHKPEPALPEAPLIVLINSKSGGRTGPQTAAALRHALGYSQVFDMGEHRPDQVLETVYKNFDALEEREPERARALRSRLRVIVAGGDGTVGWTLQAIKRCGIEPHPPVAIIPLGTGNDMSRTFGWGAAFDPAWVGDHDSLYKTLRNVADAAPTQLDRWQLRMRAPGPQYFQKEMPPTIMASNDAPKESAKEYQGLSWNYLSIGMDARTVYGFDRLRAKKPQLAPGGNINKFWYVFFCCFSGWFVGGGSTLPDKLHMEIQDAKGNWSHLHVPDNLSSVVFLNNQSYAGGQDLWQHDKGGDKDGWARPTYNDGLIDIVGFQSGYHAGAVLAKATPCTRLAQAAGVRVRVKGLLDGAAQEKGETDHVYVQLDGEPWQQDVPSGEGEFVEMEFTRVGQSTMLKAPPSSTR